jgi:hypothetical protein
MFTPIRVGDRVQFRIDSKGDYYKGKGDPTDKMMGTVVSFTRFIDYSSRFGSVVRKPGVYELNGQMMVQWDDGTITQPNQWNVHMLDEQEEKARYALRREETTDSNWDDVDAKYEQRVYIGDLPESRAWEQDFVKVDCSRFNDHSDRYGIIQSIDYDFQYADGQKVIKYTYRMCDEAGNELGGSTYADESEITIIKRGNVYKYYNGEPLQFKDLNEESYFFMLIGMTTEVRNPANQLFSWDLPEVLAAIRNDIVDGFNISNNPFNPSTTSIKALRFNDRDLGKRVQEQTLAGFSDM